MKLDFIFIAFLDLAGSGRYTSIHQKSVVFMIACPKKSVGPSASAMSAFLERLGSPMWRRGGSDPP